MADLEMLKGLLARVRDASEGSRDLNEAIHGALRPEDPFWRAICEGRRLHAAGRSDQLICATGCNMRADSWARDAHVQDHSGSVDAAVALVGRVLPGWSWEVRRSGFGTPAQAILHDPMQQPAPGYDTRVDHPAGVPALALCAALLSALIAQAEQGGPHGA